MNKREKKTPSSEMEKASDRRKEARNKHVLGWIRQKRRRKE